MLPPRVPGRTDRFARLRAVLAHPIGRQAAVALLDSYEPATIGGKYCAERLDWLATELAKAPEIPVVVFVHHPPFNAGFAHFRHIGFHSPEPLLEALHSHPAGVQHLLFGHIHISLSDVTECGISYTSGRASSQQFIVEPEDLGLGGAPALAPTTLLSLSKASGYAPCMWIRWMPSRWSEQMIAWAPDIMSTSARTIDVSGQRFCRKRQIR
ncbi:hypothetical protein HIO72_07880 [Halomonas sp. PA5]|nr:hypothetical protein HIO72_07880 [Halomonas sp. PA5]